MFSLAYHKFLLLLFLCVVAFIVLYPLFLGRFYAIGDMRDVTIPLELFFQQEQRSGRLPAWQPDVAWGFPVIASAQIGFFYPPLLLGRLLPIWLYLPLIVTTHVIALLVGGYIFLRRSTSQSAALFGSMTFGLSAFVWQHTTHLNIFLSMAWLPWQLVVAQRLLQKPAWRGRDVAYLALLTGTPFLIGQLQLPFLQSVFVAWYLWAHRRQRSAWQVVKLLGLSGVIAVMLASAQIFPTLELLTASTRAEAGDFDLIRANQHSFPLYHLPTILFPRFFGSDTTYWGKRLEVEYGIFVGTLPLLLALWVVIRMRYRKIPAGPLRFWLGTALLGWLLALGSASPFRLVGIEPSLWFFSAPARWLLFTCFSLSVLAAEGLDAARQQPAAAARFFFKTSLLLFGLVVIGNVAIYLAPLLATAVTPRLLSDIPGEALPYYQQKIASLQQSVRDYSVSFRNPYSYLPLLASLAGVLAFHRRSFSVLLGVTTVELILVAATTTPTIPWQQILSPPTTLNALPPPVRQGEARLISLQPPGDTGAWFTNPASRPDAAAREQGRQLLVPLLSAQHGVPGVAWPASLDLRAQAKALERLQADGPATFDIQAAAQRTIGAVLVPQAMGNLAGLAPFAREADTAIYTLAAAPRAELVSGGSGLTGQVTYESVNPGWTRLTVNSRCHCLLVVRDSFYPGWKAFVDGQAVALNNTEDIFRAIMVPAGRHVVDLRYRPGWLYAGLVTTAFGVFFCVCLVGPFRDRVLV